MDLTRHRSRVRKVITEVDELYPHDLQLYTIPPHNSISLNEFEELVVERLKVLRIIEQINWKTSNRGEEWRNLIITEIKKQNIKPFPKLALGNGCSRSDSDVQARKKDHISHFLLRLAYCRTEDLRRWFVARELDFFRLRFHLLTADGVKQFLHYSKLSYTPISPEKKSELLEHLIACTPFLSSAIIETCDFYKVPFTDVFDLVRSRKVYLSDGYAYVPNTEFISILSSIFRSNISHALVVTFRHLANIETDERISSLIRCLHTAYTGEDFLAAKNKEDISVENLDQLARSSFPLCMRQLHEKMRAVHHLKHWGRQQYGLFLKGIGLSLENALRFWKEEFCKIMDVDKFYKQYSYNIRHNYGQEGKRADYTPYSCMKIITSNVGPGDTHGCPFKHSDSSSLKQMLLNYSIPTIAAHEIVDLAGKGHFQLACGKYFEVTHGSAIDVGVNHPNKYFEESQKLLNKKSSSNSTTKSKSSYVKKEVKSEDVWGDDFDTNDFNITALEEAHTKMEVDP